MSYPQDLALLVTGTRLTPVAQRRSTRFTKTRHNRLCTPRQPHPDHVTIKSHCHVVAHVYTAHRYAQPRSAFALRSNAAPSRQTTGIPPQAYRTAPADSAYLAYPRPLSFAVVQHSNFSKRVRPVGPLSAMERVGQTSSRCPPAAAFESARRPYPISNLTIVMDRLAPHRPRTWGQNHPEPNT